MRTHCVICSAPTARLCEDGDGTEGYVCTKHFVEGYGRLPDMLLPKPPAPPEPPLYVADKDKA